MVPLVFGVVILPCILATRYTCIERDNLTYLYIQIFTFFLRVGRMHFYSNIKSYYPRDIISLCRIRPYMFMLKFIYDKT